MAVHNVPLFRAIDSAEILNHRTRRSERKGCRDLRARGQSEESRAEAIREQPRGEGGGGRGADQEKRGSTGKRKREDRTGGGRGRVTRGAGREAGQAQGKLEGGGRGHQAIVQTPLRGRGPPLFGRALVAKCKRLHCRRSARATRRAAVVKTHRAAEAVARGKRRSGRERVRTIGAHRGPSRGLPRADHRIVGHRYKRWRESGARKVPDPAWRPRVLAARGRLCRAARGAGRSSAAAGSENAAEQPTRRRSVQRRLGRPDDPTAEMPKGDRPARRGSDGSAAPPSAARRGMRAWRGRGAVQGQSGGESGGPLEGHWTGEAGTRGAADRAQARRARSGAESRPARESPPFACESPPFACESRRPLLLPHHPSALRASVGVRELRRPPGVAQIPSHICATFQFLKFRCTSPE